MKDKSVTKETFLKDFAEYTFREAGFIPLAILEKLAPERKDEDMDVPEQTIEKKLVWHKGPALGGGGTAQKEHGPDWWYDGELLLVIVETAGGRVTQLVECTADEFGNTGFLDPVTGDDNFGYSDEAIAWWAKVEPALPKAEEA